MTQETWRLTAGTQSLSIGSATLYMKERTNEGGPHLFLRVYLTLTGLFTHIITHRALYTFT